MTGLLAGVHELLQPEVLADEVVVVAAVGVLPGAQSPRLAPPPHRQAGVVTGQLAGVTWPEIERSVWRSLYTLDKEIVRSRKVTRGQHCMHPPCAQPHLTALLATLLSVHAHRHLPRPLRRPPSQNGIP